MPTEDDFELNLDLPELNLEASHFWKYEEDVVLKEVRDYLSGTYKSHYTSQDSKTQTLDLIESIGDAEPFCRSNAIKYLSWISLKQFIIAFFFAIFLASLITKVIIHNEYETV